MPVAVDARYATRPIAQSAGMMNVTLGRSSRRIEASNSCASTLVYASSFLSTGMLWRTAANTSPRIFHPAPAGRVTDYQWTSCPACYASSPSCCITHATRHHHPGTEQDSHPVRRDWPRVLLWQAETLGDQAQLRASRVSSMCLLAQERNNSINGSNTCAPSWRFHVRSQTGESPQRLVSASWRSGGPRSDQLSR